MLALFTELLQSPKISGPRLELHLSRPPRSTIKMNLQIAQTRRPRKTTNPQPVKRKEPTTPSVNVTGIIETTEGFQYHPELMEESKPKRTRQTKKKADPPAVVRESKRKEVVGD